MVTRAEPSTNKMPRGLLGDLLETEVRLLNEQPSVAAKSKATAIPSRSTAAQKGLLGALIEGAVEDGQSTSIMEAESPMEPTLPSAPEGNALLTQMREWETAEQEKVTGFDDIEGAFDDW